MSLGDVYGKVNRSGTGSSVNAVTRSSEDGSEFLNNVKKSREELNLIRKNNELASFDKQVADLKRTLMNAELHKSADGGEYRLLKTQIESKLRQIDQTRRKTADEIRHLEQAIRNEARRRM